MTPEHFARLREVVLTAATLPPEDRPAYLDDACGADPDLRREAASLLEQREEAPSLLQTTGMQAMVDALREAAATPAKRPVPEHVGPYRILGVMGEGGMGTVYRAEQTEPIRREVALKVIRAGSDSIAVLARFQAERQTLALMDHPNIARVLEAGDDGDGRPYFVMDLIRGIPITAYCEENGLPARDRLRLFLEVCRAVRHAHRKGIIHRDLKPSNVLVTTERGKVVPKVIDFSIAKVLDDPGLGTEHRTRTGQVIGTLEYMSPEQARGEIASVDTRSDVYSLGVMAFELLTGRLPHDTRGRPLHEAVRRISEETPSSWRVRGARTTVTGRIDADVETIVGTCLEKEPERRYGSAGELVEDLERYFASKPILARRPTAGYQLRKLLGRHKLAAGLVAASILFLLAFAITVTVQLGIQRAEREKARRAARRAERSNEFLERILGAADPESMGRDVTVREVLDQAAREVDVVLAGDPEQQADALGTLARTYRGLGMDETAIPLARRAVDLRRRMAGDGPVSEVKEMETLASLLLDTRKLGEARSTILEALHDRRATAGTEDAEVARLTTQLADVQSDMREWDQAVATARDAVRIWESVPDDDGRGIAEAWNELAMIYNKQRKHDEGIEYARRALSTLTAVLGPDHPETLDSQEALATNIVRGARNSRETLEGIRIMRDVVERTAKVFGPDHFRLAARTHQLAYFLMRSGYYKEALPLQQKALGIWLEVFGEDHPYVGIARNNIAYIQHGLGNYDAALAGFRRALAAVERTGVPGDEVASLGNVTRALHHAGRYAEALEMTNRLLERRRAAGMEEYDFWTRMEHGCLLAHVGRFDEAVDLLRQAADGVEENANEARTNCAKLALCALAGVRAAQGRWDEVDGILEEQGAGAWLLEEERPTLNRRHLLETNLAIFRNGSDTDRVAKYEKALAILERTVQNPVLEPDAGIAAH